MLVTVYCSGSIAKGPEDSTKVCWSDGERALLSEGALPVEIQFLNPDDPIDRLEDNYASFGRDMYQVRVSDFVVVDGRERRGVGVGVELLASRLWRTPLIAVVPPESHYRRSNVCYRGTLVHHFLHSHIDCLADAIVDDFAAAGEWIREYVRKPQPIKTLDEVARAIEYYERTLLPFDTSMQLHNSLSAQRGGATDSG